MALSQIVSRRNAEKLRSHSHDETGHIPVEVSEEPAPVETISAPYVPYFGTQVFPHVMLRSCTFA